MVLKSLENLPQIRLGGPSPKPDRTPDENQETQEFKKPDRRNLDLPLKPVDATISQQSEQGDESVWPEEESPKSSTPRQSLDPGADLPNYSMISVVGNNDVRRVNHRSTYSVQRTITREKRSPTEFQRKDHNDYVPKDWYHDLQLRLDSLLWKFQNLDQEYAFLQKIAGEQYDGVKKLMVQRE